MNAIDLKRLSAYGADRGVIVIRTAFRDLRLVAGSVIRYADTAERAQEVIAEIGASPVPRPSPRKLANVLRLLGRIVCPHEKWKREGNFDPGDCVFPPSPGEDHLDLRTDWPRRYGPGVDYAAEAETASQRGKYLARDLGAHGFALASPVHFYPTMDGKRRVQYSSDHFHVYLVTEMTP